MERNPGELPLTRFQAELFSDAEMSWRSAKTLGQQWCQTPFFRRSDPLITGLQKNEIGRSAVPSTVSWVNPIGFVARIFSQLTTGMPIGSAGLLTIATFIMGGFSRTYAQATGSQKPNILFIMGDDIGWMQPGIYHRGLMVRETPNIDRIGREGAMLVDCVAMQSCTRGRNAFFTGMYPLRTGLITATARQPFLIEP
jgi:hypothetical protein